MVNYDDEAADTIERLTAERDALAAKYESTYGAIQDGLLAEVQRLTAERDALREELALRRKSRSASDRLHNLCEGIAKDADGSEWSREEWERLDAEMLELKREIERLTAERDALRILLGDVASALEYHQEQTRPIHSTKVALDAVAHAARKEATGLQRPYP